MRIIFVNLHASWMLVKNSAVLIFKNSAALKHKYLLDYMLENPDIEVCSYLNDRSFSIYTHGGNTLQKFLNLFSKIEHNWILKKNGIDRKKVKVLTSPKEIREDDIVILYNLFPNTFRGMDKARGKKIVSFLHFNGNNSDSDRINSISPVALFNEVDLSQSCELYKRYYHIEAPWTVIPYIPAERFRRIKPFKERKNKAFSVGTITYKTHKEFLEVYGDPCDQPIRKAVKDNPEFFKDTADSYSSDYLEDDKVLQVKENDNSLFKFIKKAKNRFTIGKQKQYFSFDMVEKFNEYKMHIVGEEILGIPGIGFVEGMACGSAYIGMDLPAYRDWGMIPGKHFITYDGTIEGLRDTIKFWQQPENQEKLETIANNGYEFVKSNFNSEKLSRKLLQGFYAI